MRRYVTLAACGGMLTLLAVAPVWGQTFSYSEDFNNWGAMEQIWPSSEYWTDGAVPKGWLVGATAVDGNWLVPQVMVSDSFEYSPTCWGTGTCYDPVWSSGRADGLGQVDYTVPWSGTPGDIAASGRFVLQHQNWENWGRTAYAWYTGADHLNGGSAPHTGTYPMDLRTNYIKAEFDLSIRTGSQMGWGYWDSPTNLEPVSADAVMFAVQPISNLGSIVTAGNWLGIGGIPGFNIEFNFYPNGQLTSGTDFDKRNHVGVNVELWGGQPGVARPSVVTNVDAPFASSIVGLQMVGDNNQPVHVTVFYNDPAHGGIGVVRVYMYVDPATKAAGDPAVPAGQAPFSFGMEGDPLAPKNGGLGELVLETCVGEWASEQAVFGFLGVTGGTNAVMAVDNVAVQTDTASGTLCGGFNTVTITKDTDAAEPGTNGQFTISRVGPTTSDLLVYYTVGGTASNNVDYAGLPGYALTTPTNGSVTIPAGSSSVAIPVEVIDDTILEGTETVYVTLYGVGTYLVGLANAATMTLTDNEASTYAAPTFVYSEDYNNWPNMLTNSEGIRMALGWRPWGSGYWNPTQSQPGIYAEEWGGANWGSDYPNPGNPWTSRWGPQGVLNYQVPWSGTPGDIYHTGRYNLIHPGRDCNYMNVDTWYTGADYIPAGCIPRHSGTYPMDLTTDSMRAEFDVSLRTGGQMTADYGISGGITFAVYPVDTLNDIVLGGTNGAWLGWGPGQNGAPGFAIEMDLRQDGGDVNGNHMGINVGLLWNNSTVQSLVVNDAIPNMVAVGDNNQPLHVTVYYNDPAQGGPGWLKVYLKVKAADKAAGDPEFPTGQAPYSYGEGAGDPADGILVLEACMGPWPAGKKAVFGFTSSLEWYPMTTISQVDNVHVETAATSGEPCTPTLLPVYVPDPQNRPVTLTVDPIPDKTLENLSQPGWDVRSYPMFGDWTTPVMQFLKQSIVTCENYGVRGADLVGEPNLNYYDADGGATNVPNPRIYPGLNSAYWNNWFGIAAKGWIYFPQAGDYSLCANCDDAVEIKIGGQNVLDTGGDGGASGTGFDGGYIINLTVTKAGVYPIQLLFHERWGWSALSFYRRVPASPLLPQVCYVPVGSSDGGYADQPLVFGLLDETNVAPLDLENQPAWNMAVVDVSPTQKVGEIDAVGGNQAFKCKVIQPYFYWWGGSGLCIGCSGYEESPTNGMRYADALNGIQAESQIIAFGNSVFCNNDGCWWDNSFNLHNAGAWDQPFPGLAGHSFSNPYDTPDNFTFRAEGYAVFDHAGYYVIGMQSDDNARMAIGEQAVQLQWCCAEPGRVVCLHITEPGTYPIRIDMVEGGGGEKLRVYECAPGHVWTALNGPDSTIRVYTTLAVGTHQYRTNGTLIPAARKVAEVGQGGELGWNGTFAKTTNGFNPDAAGVLGVGTAMVENNMYVPGTGEVTGFATQSTAALAAIDLREPSIATQNCGDWGQNQSRFAINDAWGTVFGPPAVADGNNNFAAAFDGYIEFPAAGDYLFNMILTSGYLRIGGEFITGWLTADGGPTENDAMTVRIDAPGIYDIRVDFLESSSECTPVLELISFQADGTALPLNDAANPIKVYRNLAAGVTPQSTDFRKSFSVPASAKAGPFNAGGESGFRVQVIKPTYVMDQWGDSQAGFGPGRDSFYSIIKMSELMDTVLDPAANPIGALNYSGTVVFDGTTSVVDFGGPDGNGNPYYGNQNFPAADVLGIPQHFGVRVTGYIALKKGGHVLSLYTDDGSKFWVGGQLIAYGGSSSGLSDRAGYVYIPEDGTYPFQVDYRAGGAPNCLHLRELVPAINSETGQWTVAWEYLNTGNASKTFVTLCPVPWADANGDQDVDQADFGIFQACFTGTPALSPLPTYCKCFDKAGTPGEITVEDYNAFMNCWTGPMVPSTGCP